MLKTRGRKRHTRMTCKKCIHCTNWKERKSSMRRTYKKRRTNKKNGTRCRICMHGGRSDEPTVRTIEGMPVTNTALVSIPGKGIYDITKFSQHTKYMDFQGPGGTPGYD